VVSRTGERVLHLASSDGVEANRSALGEEQAPAIAKHLADEDLRERRKGVERSLHEGEIREAPASANHLADEDLRKSLRIACARARLQRVRAEHLVIDIKQIWATMPGMDASRTEWRLSEIITACISEYYEKEDQARS
jgi:hypothetical protein